LTSASSACDVGELLVSEVLLHPAEEVVGYLWRGAHEGGHVVERQLLALGEEVVLGAD
jgi:hypothetical protein